MIVGVAALCLTVTPGEARSPVMAANQHQPQQGAAAGDDDTLTPQQKMQKRFPQSVRVGDLIGLPVLDDDDSTIGYVREVVRSVEGRVFLIVPYSAWFGWAHTEWGKRPVAVPIEVVTILARQLNSVDMPREDYDEAPTWTSSQDRPIPPDDRTLIGLGRR
jgi:hypothetical protein